MKYYLFLINPKTGEYEPEAKKAHLEAALARHHDIRNFSYDVAIPPSLDALAGLIDEKLGKMTPEARREASIVPVGGDGTVLRVLESFLDKYPETNLGIIPSGTGNLLACNLGIPLNMEDSLKALLSGKPHAIDLACVNGQYFALTAGAGIDAEIMASIGREEKKRLGIFAYFVKGFRKALLARQALFRINIDGKVRIVKGIGVLVVNAANIMGPMFRLTPEARPDDGMLDVCVLKVHDNLDYIPIVAQLLTRQYRESKESKIRHYKGRNIKIDSWPRLKVQADGEILGTTPAEFTVLPRRLNIILAKEEAVFQPTLKDELNISVHNLLRLFMPPAPPSLPR